MTVAEKEEGDDEEEPGVDLKEIGKQELGDVQRRKLLQLKEN